MICPGRFLLLTVAVAALYACGPGADSASPDSIVRASSETASPRDAGATGNTTPPAMGPGGPRTFLKLLAAVPDTPELRREIYLNDYDRALERLELDRPARGDEIALGAFLQGLRSPTLRVALVPVAFAESPALTDAWQAAYGFSILDARADLVTGLASRDALSVVATDVEPDTIRAAVQADQQWAADLRELEREGADHYAWTEEPERVRIERAAAPRDLGRGGSLAINGSGMVLRSSDAEVVAAALDALDGGRRSLADDDAFIAVARALDGAKAHTARITTVLHSADQAALEAGILGDPARPGDPGARVDLAEAKGRMEDVRKGLITLPPYRVLGIGETLGEDGHLLVVLAYATWSAEAADQTVAATRSIVNDGRSLRADRPWADWLEVRSATTDGTLATITLEAARPQIAYNALERHDSLFLTD